MMLNARTQTKTNTGVNTPASVTFPAIVDRRWVVLMVDASVSGGTVVDGGSAPSPDSADGSALLEVVSVAAGNVQTVLWSTLVPSGSPRAIPLGSCGGQRCRPNEDLLVRLTGDGATYTARVNVLVCGE